MKKNINEEIERIKSLFTEERLYGNLIVEEEETGNEEGDGEEKDPFSKDAVKQGKKKDKTDNIIKNKQSKKSEKDELEACNTSLKRYHQSFFNINPVKRRDVIKVIGTEGKYKTQLEACITNYKDKLHVRTFAGMTKDEILNMLLVMLDPNGDQKEREKYKSVKPKDSILRNKPTTTITTKKPENITDGDGNTWGTVEIVKNRQKVFLIRVVKGESVVTNNEWSQVNKVLDNFIPALIKAILSINPELKTEIKDSNELKVLKTEGTSYSGEQIKIKVI